MDPVISPLILFALLAVGALGMAFALPRAKPSPQVVGALIAGAAVGTVILILSIKAGRQIPNLFFYVFGAIALGSALRVVTHQRPVYAALFFILTILSTAGMFLLLAAEFMTFAIIIIYAGAILITYLFVIMLATETPRAEALDALKEYDLAAREPIAATVVGFVLLAVLTSMISQGLPGVTPARTEANTDEILVQMPRKIERAFEEAGFRGFLAFGENEGADITHSTYDVDSRTAALWFPADLRIADQLDNAIAQRDGDEPVHDGVAALAPGALALVDFGADPNDPRPQGLPQAGAEMLFVTFPPNLTGENIELVGFALLQEHPLVIELAGLILLLALVGAVILARMQVEAAESQVVTLGETMGERRAA